MGLRYTLILKFKKFSMETEKIVKKVHSFFFHFPIKSFLKWFRAYDSKTLIRQIKFDVLYLSGR